MFVDKIPSGRVLSLVLGGIGAWLAVRYLLPVALPFLLGAGIALAAEPVVTLLTRKVKFRRWVAAAVGVSLVFLLLVGSLVVLVAVLVRQAGRLSAVLPELAEVTRDSLGSLEAWLLSLVGRIPGEVGQVLRSTILELFSGSGNMMDGLVERGLGLASRLLTVLTDGALGLITGVLAAYMISVRLPWMKERLGARLERYSAALAEMKRAVVGWLLAQLKLAGMAFGLMALSFWLLRIRHGLLWAAVIALVDAVPILGCGMVLVPWSVVCFLKGQSVRAWGLLGAYALVWLVRSVLEPRLLGKELGLDPLVTLIAIYGGLKLFGFLGMLLAPVLVMVGMRVVTWKRVQ